jgi:hypothetical protein
VVGESEVVVTSKRVSGRSEYLQIGEGFLLAKSRLQGMILRRMLNIDSTLVNMTCSLARMKTNFPSPSSSNQRVSHFEINLMF